MNRLSDRQLELKPLVVIVGPTAVGKSRVAIEVAKRYGTDILTADSRQVYRGMDLGTDKPSLEDRQGVAHHLIDLVDTNEPFNAGLYRRRAAEAIDEHYRSRRLPLVVGGTGLYVRALLKGLCEAPPADPVVRAQLRQAAREKGPDHLYARLVETDPVTAAKLHPRDTAKIIRAVEVIHLSGRPMSSFQSRHGFSERPYRALVIGLNRERDALYRRIEARIDRQMAEGLVEETKRLLAAGASRDSGAMKGLGYRHVAAHLAGDYDEAEMLRRFKRDTRQFAKRQMTWFRSESGIEWMMVEDTESVEHTASRLIDRIERFLTALERSEQPLVEENET